MRNLVILGLIAVLVFPVMACGTGGSTSTPTTLTFGAIAGFTGVIVSLSGGMVFVNQQAGAGDGNLNESARGVIRFDISGIPAGATILSATLTIEQTGLTGAPYVDLGNLLVDHVDLGAAVDVGDRLSPALDAAFAVLSMDATFANKSVDATSQVQADVNAGRTTSDYRFLFAMFTDGNGDFDTIDLDDAGGTFGNPAEVPTLVVTFQ